MLSTILLALQDLGNDIKKEITRELQQQGHTLTGNFINSIEFDVETEGADIYMTFTYFKYGVYLQKGVHRSKIPYGGRSKKTKGRVKISKYIQALIEYAKKRGMHQPRKAAFAIANTHKRQRMPTKGSYRFSKNKRRKFFQDYALAAANDTITDQTYQIFEYSILLTLENRLKDFVQN